MTFALLVIAAVLLVALAVFVAALTAAYMVQRTQKPVPARVAAAQVLAAKKAQDAEQEARKAAKLERLRETNPDAWLDYVERQEVFQQTSEPTEKLILG